MRVAKNESEKGFDLSRETGGGLEEDRRSNERAAVEAEPVVVI